VAQGEHRDGITGAIRSCVPPRTAPDTRREITRRFEADPRKVRGMAGDSERVGGAVDQRFKATTGIIA
jgi:hypothetical protein